MLISDELMSMTWLEFEYAMLCLNCDRMICMEWGTIFMWCYYSRKDEYLYVICMNPWKLMFSYVDYDWCEAYPQWFWPPTCLYELVDGVQD